MSAFPCQKSLLGLVVVFSGAWRGSDNDNKNLTLVIDRRVKRYEEFLQKKCRRSDCAFREKSSASPNCFYYEKTMIEVIFHREN